MNFSSGRRSSYKPFSKKNLAKYLGAHIDSSIRIHLWVWHCKFQQPGYYDFGAVTFSYYTHIEKSLVVVSPNGVNVQWIYPGLISDSKKSDVISLVEEEHAIVSDKEFFKPFMSEK